MSIGRSFTRFEPRTCPQCGTLQESPGSTVCEQCGADLTPRGAAVAPRLTPRPISQLKPLFGKILRMLGAVPVWAVRRGLRMLLWPVFLAMRILSFALRGAVAVVLLAALIVGLSYIPQVRARVPIIKEVLPLSKTLLQGVEGFGGHWLVRLAGGVHLPWGTSRSATQRSGGAPTALSQPGIVVNSTPSGATVLLNTRRVGKTPLVLKVNPGAYKLTVSLPGYISSTRTVNVQAGKATALDVVLTVAP